MAYRKIGDVGKRENTGTRKIAMCAGEKRYFTGLPCTHGHIAERQTTNGRCVVCSEEYADANRACLRLAVRRSEIKNKEKNAPKRKQVTANNRKTHSARVNAGNAKRRSARIQRTPAWLTADDHWMIEQVYELAALRTKMFGFAWHVDHIVPLQGKRVSGLHTPYNLQVIPGRDNLRKNNRYEVIF
jgi:hypothetical protein